MQAKIALLQAQAQEAATKSTLNDAKVPVENARAGNMSSERDLKDLDFLQKQEGVQDEREMLKEQQRQEGTLQNQMLKQQHDERMANFGHKSELLKQHAQASLNPPKKGSDSSK